MVRNLHSARVFIDRCEEDRELLPRLHSFQKAARELIDAKLARLFRVERVGSSMERLEVNLHAAEGELRMACKDRGVIIPNLTLSHLTTYAVRPRRTPPRKEGK